MQLTCVILVDQAQYAPFRFYLITEFHAEEAD